MDEETRKRMVDIIRKVEQRKYPLSQIMSVTAEDHAEYLRRDILTALSEEFE